MGTNIRRSSKSGVVTIEPKDIEVIKVERSHLESLSWHLDQIKFPKRSIDYISILCGALASFLFPYFTEIINNGHAPWFYTIYLVLLGAAIIIAFAIRDKTDNKQCVEQFINEAKHDLFVICDRSNLVLTSQVDHDGVSSQASDTYK